MQGIPMHGSWHSAFSHQKDLSRRLPLSRQLQLYFAADTNMQLSLRIGLRL